MTSFGVRRRGRALLRRLAVRADSNFKFSFVFASQAQQDGLKAVYEFCRAIDDIVDERPHGPEGEASAAAQLEQWREDVNALHSGAPIEPARAEALARLRHTINTFELPREPMLEIIDGCAMDLHQRRYENLAQLEPYAYRVASCVGFLCLPIFGDTSEAAHRFARNLGLAMQYTNILRDVGEDAAEDRVYLPLRWLAHHGIDVDELKSGIYDPRFEALAARMAQVARAHYKVAWAALAQCPRRRSLVPAEIMGRTYEQLLDRLEAARWDVFTRQVKLRRRDKLRLAAGALRRASLGR